MGRLHSSDEFSASELLDFANARRTNDDLVGAMQFTGAALSLVDRADLWIEYARLSRTLTTTNNATQRAARDRMVPAAIAASAFNLTRALLSP